MKERVQKLMAQANIGSRRACEDFIRQGRVRVNGAVIKLGDQADPHTDEIEVDGQKLVFPGQRIYIAFNKPRNVVSSNVPYPNDPRRTVRDMVPVEGHLFTIGRLDADSEGLMVLTNDGDLANKLSHPSYQHTKTYKVIVHGLPSAEALARWQSGIEMEDEDSGKPFRTAPCYVKLVEGGKDTTLRVVMTEGKKRQIRRVAAILGYPVKSLVRTHIGKLGIGTLRPGEWRELTAKDLHTLKSPADEWREVKPAAAKPRRARQPAQRKETSRQTPSKRPTTRRRRP